MRCHSFIKAKAITAANSEVYNSEWSCVKFRFSNQYAHTKSQNSCQMSMLDLFVCCRKLDLAISRQILEVTKFGLDILSSLEIVMMSLGIFCIKTSFSASCWFYTTYGILPILHTFCRQMSLGFVEKPFQI